MKRKTFILILLAFLVITLGVVFSVFYQQNKARENAGQPKITFKEFLPFGRLPSLSNLIGGGNNPNGTDENGEGINSLPRLRKIVGSPVAGGVFVETARLKEGAPQTPGEDIPLTRDPNIPLTEETELVPAVRFVDRSSGHIYEMFLDKTEVRKIANTTIPGVQEAIFTNNGEGVILRFLNSRDNRSIESYTAPIPTPAASGVIVPAELRGAFLRRNIFDLSVSSDTKQIFSLYPFTGGSAGEISGTSGEKNAQVITSPLKEWLGQWPNAKLITMTTKPSGKVPGYAYALDPQTKSFTKILGNIAGLTTLTSPDGKMVLYSASTDTGFKLYMFDRAAGTSREILPTTLPEKCAWAANSQAVYCGMPETIPEATYPDAWYQGKVSFIDSFWKIKADGTGAEIMAVIDISEVIDATHFSIDPKERFIVFTNKKNGSLWSLRLN